MSSSVFFSWQSDRSTNVCRNFIQRALEDAIQRLKADAEVELSLREELGLDMDTQNVPGSPEIFKTITLKIAMSGVFVADLTFVGDRANGGKVSNPNVLIEYGYALNAPGELRMISVMNCAYGEPTPSSMPFNMGHKRFPIKYTLQEGATDDERKAAKRALTDSLESALGLIFKSTEFKDSEISSREPSAAEMAISLKKELEYKEELETLKYGEGLERARKIAHTLIEVLKNKCQALKVYEHFGIEFGATFGEGNNSPWFAARTQTSRGLHVIWEQAPPGLREPNRLNVREFDGHLLLPGETPTVIFRHPQSTGQVLYVPTLSRKRELGWVEKMRANSEQEFISTEELADILVKRLLKFLPS